MGLSRRARLSAFSESLAIIGISPKSTEFLGALVVCLPVEALNDPIVVLVVLLIGHEP